MNSSVRYVDSYVPYTGEPSPDLGLGSQERVVNVETVTHAEHALIIRIWIVREEGA